MTHKNFHTDLKKCNLVEIISSHAQENPNKIAFGFLPDGECLESILTYSELDKSAKALASHLQSLSLAGKCVLLHFKPGIEFVISFWACLYAGVIAVPTHLAKPNTNNWRRLESIILDAKASAFLTASDTYSILHKDFNESSVMQDVRILQMDNILKESSHIHYKKPELGDDTIAFLQYTSGSTGNPKGVIVSHGNLIHNEEILRTGCGTNSDSVFVSWLPLFHDMGLIGKVIHSAYLGATCYLMPPAVFIQKPFLWLKAISDYRATTSFAPNFAYELCVARITKAEIAELDLSCWDTALNGAEPIRASTMKAFGECFASAGLKAGARYPGYGLAEATLMVSGHVDRESHPISQHFRIDGLEKNQAILADADTSPDDSREIVCCGRPLLDQDVIIVNPESRMCLPDGMIGEIWIAGGSVALGYWKNEIATEETFRARLATDANKFYMRTGDLGFMLSGQLYLSGRLKDVLIIRGRNHYPQDIEATTQTASVDLSVDRAAAFSVPGEQGDELLVVVQEIKRTSMRNIDPVSIMSQIRRRIAEEHDLYAHRIVLLRPGQLPRTSSGKIQRRLCRQQFLEGSLAAVPGVSAYGEIIADEAVDTSAISTSPNVAELLDWLRHYSSRRINSRLMDERRALTPSVILDLGNKGLLGMIVPTALGGPGYNYAGLIAAVELLGAIDQSLALLVLLNNVLGIYPILQFGTDEQRQKILPTLATGRGLAAFALTEPSAGSNPRGIRSVVRPVVENQELLTLSGDKSWIGSAAWSTYMNVFAQEYDAAGRLLGMSAFVVEQNDMGVFQGAEAPTMGMRAMLQNAVHFRNVNLSHERRLGAAGKGMEIAQSAMNLGRLGIGAMALGGIRRCLQLMLRYSSRRTISSGLLLDNPVTQATIQKLVSSANALDAIIKLVVAKTDTGKPVAAELYSVIKIAGSEFFWDASDSLMQTLGGRGYIENNIAPQLMRDARILRIFEGPTETLMADLGSRFINAEISRQLLAVEFGCTEVASRFDLASSQLCVGDWAANIEQRLMCNYQIGNLAFWAILIAANQASDTSVKDWLSNRFDAYLHYCLSNPAGAVKNDRLSVDNFLNNNDEFLAHIDQYLPGENWQTDDLLLASFTAFEQQPVASAAQFLSESATANLSQTAQIIHADLERVAPDHDVDAMVGKIVNWLVKHLRITLSTNSGDTTFAEVGLDSFNSALLTSDLSTDLGVELDITSLWNFPTIHHYAKHLVDVTTTSKTTTVKDDLADHSRSIDSMSEQEAKAKLIELLN